MPTLEQKAKYELRYVDGGMLLHSHDIDASGDAEAARLASENAFGFSIEVWQAGRFVGEALPHSHPDRWLAPY